MGLAAGSEASGGSINSLFRYLDMRIFIFVTLVCSGFTPPRMQNAE